MLVHLVKKYMIWMILSYVIVALLVQNLLIVPQNKTIAKYKLEKAMVEYDYMRITASPEFINSLDDVIRKASIQMQNFTWTDGGEKVDAGLTFYNYVYAMARKSNLDLIQVSTVENRSGKRYHKEKLYYGWNVRLTGSFGDVLHMVDAIEHSQKFLVIEDITIARGKGKDDLTTYDLTFLGIKKEAVDGAKKSET